MEKMVHGLLLLFAPSFAELCSLIGVVWLYSFYLFLQIIPAKIVQNYIPRGHWNNHIAVVFGPLGKICEIDLRMDQSDMFFAGGWSQFLALHGITEANCLLLRYDGNMTFTAKVFEPNGCQRESKHNNIGLQKSKQNVNKFMLSIISNG